MKKKLIAVIFAAILTGGMQSAISLVSAGAMPNTDSFVSTAADTNKSNLMEDYLSRQADRNLKEEFIKEHVGDLSDEALDDLLSRYYENALNKTEKNSSSEEPKKDTPVSLYRYSFQKEIHGSEYDFIQYTAVVNQDVNSENVRVIIPDGMKFVTGYGEVTDGYRAYGDIKEAEKNGEEFCLSEGLYENLPDGNLVCWDKNSSGTYSFTVEVINNNEDDAIWLIGGYGYTGSEDLTGKVTIPEEDMDADMLVGNNAGVEEEQQGDHGTLGSDLYLLLRRK